ncbi:hypothetical protein CROQUDRAFT_87716 [Cronartium quercuum f. sp. fusiforme G11]|uniref:Uncharacterized protein n=1 Tax=Cronartium quercuum f. sp. fusiforme G11 TaxID=708437 RepID=A0A9P6NNT3_9BASI|nr:hypothetical protein CROQUDRAFT_87716 [Cronartium quercuum f. sp. fusiforme G11]
MATSSVGHPQRGALRSACVRKTRLLPFSSVTVSCETPEKNGRIKCEPSSQGSAGLSTHLKPLTCPTQSQAECSCHVAAGKRITRFSGQAISPAQGGYSARQNWGRRSTPDLRAFSVSLAHEKSRISSGKALRPCMLQQ